MRLITAYIHYLNNCKGKSFIFFLIAVSCLSLKAQKVTTGPVLGAGVSWFTDEALFDSLHLYPNKPTFAYNFAWRVAYKPFKALGVSIDVAYKRMGCNRLSYNFDSIFFDYANVRSHYFSIPLNLSFFVSKHFQIDVGAEYNLLLSIKNTDRNFRTLDLGPYLRLAYRTDRFTFGLNYYAGFLPVCTIVEISRSSNGYSATNYDMFNQNVYFYIHYNLVRKRLVEQSQR